MMAGKMKEILVSVSDDLVYPIFHYSSIRRTLHLARLLKYSGYV